jgi:hypothetical protein
MMETISAEDISMAAGVLLSLGFSYLPGLNEKFAGLTPTQKRLVMLALLVVVTAGAFGLSCLDTRLVGACNPEGAWSLLRALMLAAIANQTTYCLSPRTAVCTRRAVIS